MKKLQKEIGKWQAQTFGPSRLHPYGLYHHLREEVGEVGKAFYDMEAMPSELADCIILLVGLADAFNIDLDKAVKQKMEKNKKRQWHKPNKKGVIKHKQ